MPSEGTRGTRKKTQAGSASTSGKSTVNPDVKRGAWGVIWIAIAIFLFLSMTVNLTGTVGKAVGDFGKGLLGAVSFVLPAVPLYAGIQNLKGDTRLRAAAKSWSAAVLALAAAAMIHMILNPSPMSDEWGEIIKWLWTSGVALESGGLLGGGIASLLMTLTARVGGIIVVAAVIIVCVLLLTELTPAAIAAAIRDRFDGGDEGEEYEQETAQSAVPAAKRRAPHEAMPPAKGFRLDIPITDNSGQRAADPESSNKPDIPAPRIIGVNIPKSGEAASPSAPAAAAPAVSAAQASPAHEGASEIRTGEPARRETAADRAEVEKAAQETAAAVSADAKKEEGKYTYPPLTLLKRSVAAANTDAAAELRANAEKLVETLRSFGVETRVLNVCRGPAVTRYELAPNAGVKVSRIVNLADDIALNLAASGVRIEAPIPGKAAVGIEVPNSENSAVLLRDILESSAFKTAKSRLACALGKDIAGEPIIADIAKMPHLLIAGATGSGKSVCINTLITSILYKATPQEVRMMMIDPKVVELGSYNGIPHLLVPVVTDPKKAAGSLAWAVNEMLHRYQLFKEKDVRNFEGYNLAVEAELAELEQSSAEDEADELAPAAEKPEKLPQIVIIIDELADLMMAAPRDVEDSICRLAQMARAAGMHLVIATQRPSVDVITGLIKANIPSRISFAVSSQVDSRTILDMAGAEKLLGKGDMLYYPSGVPKPIRVQGCFISDKEVENVVDFIKKSQTAAYNEQIMEQIEKNAASDGGSGSQGDDDSVDPMLSSAIEVVVEAGLASVSLLQRRLKLGYARAARLIDEMEQRGIVGPYEGSKPRSVLITRQQFLEMKQNDEG